MKINSYWNSALILFCLSILVSSASARWIDYGILLVEDESQQDMPVLVADGARGAYLAWSDGRSGVGNIYSQRIDHEGNFYWQNGGVAICPSVEGWQGYPQIINDNSGGAIIVWNDYRNGHWDIFAQRIDKNGIIQWQSDGVPICTSEGDVDSGFSCTQDGSGGAIVAWWDRREGSEVRHIYAQKVSFNGHIEWEVDGIPICTVATRVNQPEIVSDGYGGAIIIWSDSRTTTAVYGQKVNGNGEIQWTLDGLYIPLSWPSDYYKVIADGAGGAFITSRGGVTGDLDTYTSRIDSAGTLLWEVDCCSITANQHQSVIALDGNDGVVVVWRDTREAPLTGDIYAQRFDGQGVPLWSTNGIPICTNVAEQKDPQVVNDGDGNSIVVWRDSRDGIYSLYTQKINSDGQPYWAVDGVTISGTEERAHYPKIISTEDNGIYVTWYTSIDYSTEENVYIQKFGATGYWGIVDPAIESINDNPSDEGGILRIYLRGSDHDQVNVNEYPISGYNVWKRIGPALSSEYVSDDTNITLKSSLNVQEILNRDKPTLSYEQATALGFPPGDWASVGFHSAKQDIEYCLLVPTDNDSTAYGAQWNDYVVTAHTDVPSVFFISQIDSGYSVDNLPPSIPTSFEGEQISYPSGLNLTWDVNSETDLSHYELFRGTSYGFEPNSENRIASTVQSYFFDNEWSSTNGQYYKLCAVDRHGNSSEYCLLIPEEIVAALLESSSISRVGCSIKITWTLSSPVEIKDLEISRLNNESTDVEILNNSSITKEGLVYSFIDHGGVPG
ncbi:MAG: hypothetical protein JW814_05200, partial [Candidatus Krumholzibacteriota bacterium]|nr:hypothetical protein [Candidatus Krumholzibacteriota bacterium]